MLTIVNEIDLSEDLSRDSRDHLQWNNGEAEISQLKFHNSTAFVILEANQMNDCVQGC